jgi:beta-xylosidase
LTSTSRQRRGGRLAAALSLVAVLAVGCAAEDDGASPGDAEPSGAAGASSDTFDNPVLATDFADPDIVRDGDNWYSYATGQVGSSAIQVSSSPDLVTWSDSEDALPSRPDWQPVKDGLTWAPDVSEVQDRWVMHYTAREQETGLQCLALAVADTPEGPFVDESTEPLLCQRDMGGSIDSFAFRDADGKLYLFWKNDGNSQGLDTRLWVQPLSPDGTKLEGTAIDTGLKQTHPWHGQLIEAPTVVLRDGTYVLFYSANDYGSDKYAMGYATATAVTGPYTDRSTEPWVASEGEASGPGGQEVFELDGQQWMIYHAWKAGEEGYPEGGARAMWMDRLTWKDGPPGEAVPVLEGPTEDPQPRPGLPVG